MNLFEEEYAHEQSMHVERGRQLTEEGNDDPQTMGDASDMKSYWVSQRE
ncbi:unnamed protein product, partial [marine sediment metagenome]